MGGDGGGQVHALDVGRLLSRALGGLIYAHRAVEADIEVAAVPVPDVGVRADVPALQRRAEAQARCV